MLLPKKVHSLADSRIVRLVTGLVCVAAATVTMVPSTPVSAATALDMNGIALRFVYSATDSVTGNANPDGKTNNDVVVYRNVATGPGGVAIDAVVRTQLSGASIGNYDNTGSASASNPIPGTTAADNFQVDMTTSAAYGTASFVFNFYETGTWTGTGTGLPVVLRNVRVTSIDLDGSGAGNGDFQYTDLTGFQKYTVSSPSSLVVSNPSTGVTRFRATDDSNGGNRPADRVMVTYDTMNQFTAVFGNVLSGKLGYFGLLFVVDPWNGCGCTTVQSNNAYNSPPVSTSTSRIVTSGVASTVVLDDFGTYSDPDNNPFDSVKITTLPSSGTLEYYNGTTWVAVTLNQVISVSAINLGQLRFTGSTSDSIGFMVYDGLAYSTAAYTVSLSVAATPQTITFNNPGTKTNGQSFASGATATSGLTVTLESLTPGVCTVTGLTINTISNGTCTIKATQAGNGTYSAAAPVEQTFPVSSLTPQTITFANPGDKTWTGTNINITSGATATSGLTVTLVSLTPGVCTVSGLTITAIGEGTCRIRATQAGNGTYSAAPPVEQTFNISSLGGATTTTAAVTTTTVPATTTTAAVTTTTVAATTTTAAPSSTVAIAATTTTTPALAASCAKPTIAAGVVPDAVIGEPYEWTPIVTGGTVTWAITSGALPAGLALTPSTGKVSGTPTKVESATFVMSATSSCNGGTSAGSLTVTINVLPPGKIAGILWIDLNNNSKLDPKEPLLPGVKLTLKSGVSAAGVTPFNTSTVSGSDGSYLFMGIDVGNYTVTAAMSANVGLTKSYDSSGNNDWHVPVTVVELKTATANFAAVASSSMAGTVVSNTRSVVPANAKVACTWAGIDGKLGTDDDVMFSTVADANGKYSLNPVPSGNFSCAAVDAKTGKSTDAEPVSLAKTAKGIVQAAVLHFGALPVTGSAPEAPVGLSFLFLVIGIALLVSSRRGINRA